MKEGIGAQDSEEYGRLMRQVVGNLDKLLKIKKVEKK